MYDLRGGDGVRVCEGACVCARVCVSDLACPMCEASYTVGPQLYQVTLLPF